MTLRLRLFALLVALATVLAVGEWVLVRSLSADLREELASAAASVSEDVLRLLDFEVPPPEAAVNGKGVVADDAHVQRRIFVVRDHDLVRRKGAAGAAPEPVASPGLERRPLPPLAEELPLPAPGEASGVVEVRAVGPDGTVTTERRQVRARLDPSSPAHVLLLHGKDEADRVPVPTSGIEHAVERFARRLLLGSLGLFGGALLLGVVVTHRFTRPLRDLAAAARRVGGGELGVRAPAASGEVGEAVSAFNHMSEQLRALDVETQRLRASEQLSELGEVGRGLAHSLRNPLNALGLALDQLAERADADAAVTADAARRQIRRIDGALRGFLALSAGDAAATDVDVAAVARDVALEALQTRPNGADAPRVEVAAPHHSVRLRGVEAELRAALQALVVNAVEASPAGASVVITVGAERGAETDPSNATDTSTADSGRG
ncbi:MAG TPA: HAMP domain-containing protein, partial [Thermoanaerobaculia bacterium]|nr:HAMP domain-containing protein [Thermoanaerobaculia bacterium]